MVIHFESLPAFLLGCYGELRLSTPQFDRLAVESLVLENCFADPEQAMPGDSAVIDIIATGDQLCQLARASYDWQVTQPTISRQALRAAWVALSFAVDDSLRREVESAITALPLQSHVDDLEELVELLPDWELFTLLAAGKVLDADAWLGRFRQSVPEMENSRLVVTALRGDPLADPASTPEWMLELSAAATHVPLFRREPAGQLAGRRFCSSRKLGDVLRLGVENLSSVAAPDESPLRFSSGQAKSIRTRRWWLVENQQPGVSAEDTEVRLFRLPEDPWGARNVASEQMEIIEHYRATGELKFDS